MHVGRYELNSSIKEVLSTNTCNYLRGFVVYSPVWLPCVADTLRVQIIPSPESVEVATTGGRPPTREWVLVGVAKGSQLGSPERLIEKFKMVRKRPKPTTVATSTEHRALSVELQESQERERNLRARITTLSQRATAAEERATVAEERANVAKHGKREAERMSEEKLNIAELQESQERERNLRARITTLSQRATAAEERATAAEERANVAEHGKREAERMSEERLNIAEERIADSERRIHEAEMAAEEANRRAQAAERREAEAQRRLQMENQPFWAVDRQEIQFTGEKLGEGSWAEVKVAKFRGAKVAAKCLHNQIISPYNRDLFTREMNVAARVRHPNLLLFIGATLEGELIILTELMSTSLRDLLQPGKPLTQQNLVSIACDVAKALNYLHLMKPDPIIHRDVSSANVLLDHDRDDSWKAKLSDYGSANFLRQLKTAGAGNPTYAAPEANIRGQQSNKMDIFSFGVLLVEMCTAKFPDIAAHERLIRSIREPRLVGLIRQCTAEDKDRRPSAAELVTQLTELN